MLTTVIRNKLVQQMANRRFDAPPSCSSHGSEFNSGDAVIVVNPISEDSYREDSTAIESAFDYQRLPEGEAELRRFERVVGGLKLGLRN